MLAVDEALERVTSAFCVLSAEQVALPDGLGRVLAEDVAARLTQPPVAVSSMDGYAVRAEDVADVPATLTQIGMSQAGLGFGRSVGPGQCTRIFTGAPLPDGADTVIIQEVTDVAGDQVTIKESAAEGADIRPAGLDFREGDVLLRAGKRLTARDLGLAASMNVPWLSVRRRPRIAILATGDELVMPGEPKGDDQIISSNSVALTAYVRVLGGEPINLGIARDTAVSFRQCLAGAAGADVLVTIGGASVGDFDLVRQVLGEDGLDLNFYKIAMRPGKPLIFGRLGDVSVLGLPGNPVSAGVTSVIFLRAAMAVMLGLDAQAMPDTATAKLGRDLPANGMRQDYMRATLKAGPAGEMIASPFERQDSAMMARFAEANCLVVRPPEAPAAKAGDAVEILRLDLGAGAF
ncbi:MAG: molybdopterin molybdotransferase MoeA [Rhodospirillaceae bacterium]|nr:molybdopterin molybdotransferase MoeA [Rhodospirillaceae bacterium]